MPSPAGVPEVSVHELSALRDGDAPPVLLDVREPWEREIAALPDSLNIPMGEIPDAVADLPRDRAIVVMCHHGMRSARVAGWLRVQGFDRVLNLAGGIDAWARHIDPSTGTY